MKNVLKYPGSKWNTAGWIVSHFPREYQKMGYLEPFFGSGAVFFTKERSVLETINDIDDDVYNLFCVIRENADQLARSIYYTPWARTEYENSYDQENEDCVERARRFLVRMWQGIGAKSSDKTGWRKNVKSVNGNVPRFHTSLPDNILEVCERLKHSAGNKIVQIEHKDAFDLIVRHNTTETLIYADPPYVLETRHGRIYRHEFNDNDHVRLLNLLKNHKGPVVISGYMCDLYDGMLYGWTRHEKTAQTEAGNKKTECIWLNYESNQISLFGGDYE